MTRVRVSVAAFVVVLLVYYAMRIAASACSGSGCDVFVPLSLLLPLLALVVAAVTGAFAIASARVLRSGWTPLLIAATTISCVGPIVALAVFRDAPDVFVPVATVLLLIGPAVALVYSFAAFRRQY